MQLKGLDVLESKLPHYQGRKLVIIPIIGLLSITSGLVIQLLFDYFTQWKDNSTVNQIEPFMHFIGTLFVLAIAYHLVTGIWRNRDKYLEIDRKTAYEKVILKGLFGIGLVFSIVFYNYIPAFQLSDSPSTYLTQVLGLSILNLVSIGNFSIIIRIASLVLSVILTIYGIIAIKRILNLFGIDYMALVYVYYPEESEVQQSEVYDIVRHPSYSIVLLLSIAGFFASFTIYSLITIFILRIFFHLFLTRYEEKELIQRFGNTYQSYMEEVPPILPRIRDIPDHIRFVLDF